jgi:glycosyltransferase involved in cell wall biosynthesis
MTPNASSMLKHLTASLSPQGLPPDLVIDLTGCRGSEGAGEAICVWRRIGPNDTFAAASQRPGTGLFRPDGAIEARALLEAIVSSGVAETPRILALPPALAGTAAIAELARAGVDVFAVVAAAGVEAKDWPAVVRGAFDAGYVSLAAAALADKTSSPQAGAPRQITFLRSDLVREPDLLGGFERGIAAMSSLGENGRFANQLMQYAYVRLYALRHGLRPAVPHWIGADLYRRRDPTSDGVDVKELRFYAFDNDDLHLWRVPHPPIDVDLWGYFQELPACWKPHRALLRRLYALPPALADPLDERLAAATDAGRRDLAAIHVRRGDYRTLHRQGLPWYRPVPEEWYAAWLRELWPRLRDPVLYVATDEPEAVLPHFAEFQPVGTGALEVPGLPADVLDFEIMRRAGHLAIANSSFSRMAAILAPETQACACPDFGTRALVAYEPWIDEAFWSRFEAEPRTNPITGYGPDAQGARAIMIREHLGLWLWKAGILQDRLGALEAHLAERETRLRDFEAVLERDRNPSVASPASMLERLAELAGRRFRTLAERFGRSLPGAPQRLAGSSDPSPPPAAQDVAQLTSEPQSCVEIAVPARGPIVFVIGPSGTEAFSTTVSSLRAQTFRPSAILEGRETFDCGPDDLVCLVAVGTRLDPTALELLTAALLGVSEGKFAAIPAAPTSPDRLPETADESIAACLIPGRVWREHGHAIFRADPGGSLGRLGSALESVPGRALMLPGIVAVRDGAPVPGFDGASWPALRALPAQQELWSASPLDGARRVEAFVGSNPARRDEADARPHLLVIVPYLPVGGSEIVLLEVLEHMARTWAISIVTTLPDDHAMRAAFAQLTDEIYHAGDIFEPFRLQAFVSGLIAARKTRVVLSSNSAIFYRAVPELKAVHPEVAFVAILHNDLPTGLIRYAVDAATSLDRYVAVSRRVGESLVARGVPRERVVVVPNGVDTDLFSPDAVARPAARTKLGVADDAHVLAFVGRFSDEKRVGAFAEIVARVRGKVPVRAIVVGEGEDERFLRERVAREGLPIAIVPRMPRSDLVGLYAAADLVVLTSTVEGMPMVVLEAMATGCPVAVTDVGDVRRIVEPGRNGFVAPVDSPEDLAEAIVAAALEPGRLERMRESAHAAVIANGMTKAAMQEGYGRLLGEVGRLRDTSFDPADAAL